MLAGNRNRSEAGPWTGSRKVGREESDFETLINERWRSLFAQKRTKMAVLVRGHHVPLTLRNEAPWNVQPIICAKSPAEPLQQSSNHDASARHLGASRKMFPSSLSGSQIPHIIRKARKCTRTASKKALHTCSASFGSMEEQFYEDDSKFVLASVVEADGVSYGQEGFIVKLRGGAPLLCVPNAPTEEGSIFGYQPAIVLRTEDESQLMLPILVQKDPSTLLMEALRNVNTDRPTVYQAMRDMVELMGYEIKLARITHRENSSYFARVYFTKTMGDGSTTLMSQSMRPSDAINLAIRAKVPVQVSKALIQSDGIRGVGIHNAAVKPSLQRRSQKLILTDADIATDSPCDWAQEMVLVRSLAAATAEERYSDAARFRDELSELRAAKRRQQQQQEA